MKKYLEELRAQDRTEEQISEYFKTLMKAWNRPMGRGREYDVPSKFGGTRKCLVCAVPDLEAFFNDRSPITRLLFASTVDSEVKHIGGKQEPTVMFGGF